MDDRDQDEGRTGERGVGRVRPRALDADDDDDHWRRQQRRRRAADRGEGDEDEEAGGGAGTGDTQRTFLPNNKEKNGRGV